jgi:hypothetical protein
MVGALLAGCAAGADEDAALQGQAAAPSSGAAGPGASASDAEAVRVGLTEWSIAVAVPSVEPGKVTLLVTNAGGTEHDLFVEGRLGRWHTPDLDPGERTELTIRTKPGEQLRLWCSLPGHEAQGMHTVLPVRSS